MRETRIGVANGCRQCIDHLRLNPIGKMPGTGDVLSGAIAAQLAKGLAATEAACLGGFLHGLAADLAAENAVGTEGMVASDLFQFLPAAVERLKAGPPEETHVHD